MSWRVSGVTVLMTVQSLVPFARTRISSQRAPLPNTVPGSKFKVNKPLTTGTSKTQMLGEPPVEPPVAALYTRSWKSKMPLTGVPLWSRRP